MIKISPSGARLRLNGESGRKCGGTSASAVEKRCHWRFSQLSIIVIVVVIIIIVTTKSSTFEGCDRRSRNPFFQPTNFYNALLTYSWANAVITELCDIIKWISLLQGFLFGKICRFPLSVWWAMTECFFSQQKQKHKYWCKYKTLPRRLYCPVLKAVCAQTGCTVCASKQSIQWVPLPTQLHTLHSVCLCPILCVWLSFLTPLWAGQELEW